MKKNAVLKIGLMLLPVLIAFTAEAGTEGHALKGLRPEGRSLSDFVPGGWTVEDQAEGDLNEDGLPDVAAVLIQSPSESGGDGSDDERERALVVLIRRDKDTLAPVASNDDLLLCGGCGGVKEMTGIEIRKGVVIVHQMSGSREFTVQTLRFRHDPTTKRFVLIGRDVENADAILGTGKVESSNFLTGVKIIETYRHDGSGERRITVSTKREKGPKKTPFLEDVAPE